MLVGNVSRHSSLLVINSGKAVVARSRDSVTAELCKFYYYYNYYH